jgi:heme/copper-type cytochrome/quinol oxidase subunit 3
MVNVVSMWVEILASVCVLFVVLLAAYFVMKYEQKADRAASLPPAPQPQNITVVVPPQTSTQYIARRPFYRGWRGRWRYW